jgi:hypothetical protein
VAEVVIHCISQSGTDATEVATELKTYLQGINGVGSVAVEVERPHVGLAEVLAIFANPARCRDRSGTGAPPKVTTLTEAVEVPPIVRGG